MSQRESVMSVNNETILAYLFYIKIFLKLYQGHMSLVILYIKCISLNCIGSGSSSKLLKITLSVRVRSSSVIANTSIYERL